MRRPAAVLALCSLVACATPAIRLTPAFVAGSVRTYRLNTDAATTLELSNRSSGGRTQLTARSEVRILQTVAEQTTVRVTLTFESFKRDGRASTPPQPQTADLVVGTDGTVTRIVSIGGLPPEITGADVQDLAPMLGPALPTTRVHLGDRWHRTVAAPSLPAPAPSPAPAVEDGRVSALRIVNGYDCAIVRIGARRPLSRDRTVGGQPLHLEGTELSTTEIAFAFREGFPVQTITATHARFALASGTFSGASLVVESRTTLTLLSVTG